MIEQRRVFLSEDEVYDAIEEYVRTRGYSVEESVLVHNDSPIESLADVDQFALVDVDDSCRDRFFAAVVTIRAEEDV